MSLSRRVARRQHSSWRPAHNTDSFIHDLPRRFLDRADETKTAEEIRAECDWPDYARPSKNSLQNTLKKGVGKHWQRSGRDEPVSPHRYHT